MLYMRRGGVLIRAANPRDCPYKPYIYAALCSRFPYPTTQPRLSPTNDTSWQDNVACWNFARIYSETTSDVAFAQELAIV